MAHSVSSMPEMEAIIEAWDEGEDQIDTVTVLPPEVEPITEDEDLNDDLIPMNDEDATLHELNGCLEYITIRNRRSEDVKGDIAAPYDHNEDDVKKPLNKITEMEKKLRIAHAYRFGPPKWTRKLNDTKKFDYNIAPDTGELQALRNDVFDRLTHLTPLECFEQFFDSEVIEFIVNQTNLYADFRKSQFRLNKVSLRRFLGILLFSGYHTLPTVYDYWSEKPTLGVAIVKECMPMAKFNKIRRFLHFSDNDQQLDRFDSMSKIRPLFKILNRKFMQFGIMSSALSIGELTVPYFGRNSNMAHIKGKAIRFGQKLWCLCSSQGYLYSCMPYGGPNDCFNRNLGLGADVVVRLLENVKFPERHTVFFDSYFTSHHLMCILSSHKKLCATGAIKKARMGGATFKNGKQLKRGEHDFTFDSTNKILLCRWHDGNSEVTLCTNFDQIEPMYKVKKTIKNQKKTKDGIVISQNWRFEDYQQPRLFRSYYAGKGGVDLHDEFVRSYGINIRSKKWYWPLWLSALRSSMVNAWKLHCFVAEHKRETPLSHKDFLVNVTEKLLIAYSKDNDDDLIHL